MISVLVKERGHKVPDNFPFILDSKVETLNKTSLVKKTLAKLGFKEELERTSKRKVRAGKGKVRGRKYQNKTGPLFVVSQDCALVKAAKNIPGAEVIIVKNLNADVLAPGTHPGRLTIWSEASVNILANEKLFTEDYKGVSEKKVKIKLETKKERKKAPKPQVKKAKVEKKVVKKEAGKKQ